MMETTNLQNKRAKFLAAASLALAVPILCFAGLIHKFWEDQPEVISAANGAPNHWPGVIVLLAMSTAAEMVSFFMFKRRFLGDIIKAIFLTLTMNLTGILLLFVVAAFSKILWHE